MKKNNTNNNNNNNNNMNKMAQNGRFEFYKKVLLCGPFDFMFTSRPKPLPNFLLRLLMWLGQLPKVVFR